MNLDEIKQIIDEALKLRESGNALLDNNAAYLIERLESAEKELHQCHLWLLGEATVYDLDEQLDAVEFHFNKYGDE